MDSSMESSRKLEDSRNPASSSSSSAINGSLHHHHHHQNQIVTRSDHYPTTFVQADPSSFKHVVQMLTGSSPRSPDPLPPPAPTAAGKAMVPPKKQTSFKLYERRLSAGSVSNYKNSLIINTLTVGGNGSPRFSPRNPEVLSPSCLDFPNLTLSSPVTPLKNSDSGEGGDPFDKLSPLSEEDRAIAEKGFYLHPSPISTPRDSEPQLLPLFPVTSPKVSPERNLTEERGK